jgi:putative addiction module CopG family antidote
MNISLTDELKDFLQRKIEDGEYPSEVAVIEAALKRFREQDNRSTNTVSTIDDLIDHEFVEYCVDVARRRLGRPGRWDDADGRVADSDVSAQPSPR